MQINNVSEENWNTSFYTNQELKALISIGMHPESLEEVYFVSVIDNENNEIVQTEMQTLNAACRYLNNKYAETWEYTSLLKSDSSGGCSTCVAH